MLLKLKSLVLGVAIIAMGCLVGCDLFEPTKYCQDKEDRRNVVVSGAYESRDSAVFFREPRGGELNVDISGNGVFSETGVEQRIVVYEYGVRIDSSDWFRQEKDGRCNYKAVTVTFD